VSTELPEMGLVIWPVGTSDSPTIVVTDATLMRVDLKDPPATGVSRRDDRAEGPR
jgi:hypothetical protein